MKQISPEQIVTGSIQPATNHGSSPVVSVNPGGTNTAIARCPPNWWVLAGGYVLHSSTLVVMNSNAAEGRSAWAIQVFNPDTVAHTFAASAQCMIPLPP